MNRKLAFAAICCAIVMCAVALSLTLSSQSSAALGKRQEINLVSQPVSDHILYESFFSDVVELKNAAKEAERKGDHQKASKLSTSIERAAKLNNTQAQLLDQAATDCKQAVTSLDAKAYKIIGQMRAQHNGGRLRPGQPLPPLPPALISMQDERDRTILRSRDVLRGALGESAFQDLDRFVRNTLSPHLKVVPLDASALGGTSSQRSVAPQSLQQTTTQP